MSLREKLTRPINVAALILLLCIANLTGSTYALFTSSIKDGTIGVTTTSGDVEVQIVDKENNSLEGKTLQFVTTSDAPTLFEPGCTFYTQGFKVMNVGDIHVRFRISVSYGNMSEAERQEFEEAFEIGITTDPTRLSDVKPTDKFVGELKAGENSITAQTYYLVIKMKETVGNTFQGAKYDGIGITVYAVQANAGLEE
jgi:hypothetical protein